MNRRCNALTPIAMLALFASEAATQPRAVAAPEAEVAMGGYCAVCIADMTQWVAGSPEFELTYDGRRYRFPGEEQLELFQANPVRYAPVLGGDDVVAYAQTGRRVPGLPRLGARYKGRLYFFASEANKEAFKSAPLRYSQADVALGGECSVCKVNMNASMPGDPDVSALHHGLRYFFAGDEQRQSFLRDPQRFAVPVSEPAPR